MIELNKEDAIVTLKQEQIENKDFQQFYAEVAEALGCKDSPNIKFDCSKILVSQPIMDALMKYYEDRNYSDETICCYMVCYGPKTDEALGENEVQVCAGFLSQDDD